MRMTCGSGTSPSRQIGVRRSDRSSCGSKQNVMRCHALFLPEGEPRMSNSLSRKSLSLSSLQSSPCGLYLRRRKAGQARVHELDIKRGLALREREDASGGEAAQEHCRNPTFELCRGAALHGFVRGDTRKWVTGVCRRSHGRLAKKLWMF